MPSLYLEYKFRFSTLFILSLVKDLDLLRIQTQIKLYNKKFPSYQVQSTKCLRELKNLRIQGLVAKDTIASIPAATLVELNGNHAPPLVAREPEHEHRKQLIIFT